MAVGANGAAVVGALGTVGDGRSDAVRLPGHTSVRRHADLGGRGKGPAAAEAVEVRVADVRVAEEGTRLRVVRPDLLLVEAGRCRDVRGDEVRLRPVRLIGHPSG